MNAIFILYIFAALCKPCISHEDCESTCCLPYKNEQGTKLFECNPIEFCSVYPINSECNFDDQCFSNCCLNGTCKPNKDCYFQYINPYINLFLWTGGTFFFLLITSFILCKCFISYKTMKEDLNYIKHAEDRIKRIRYLLRENDNRIPPNSAESLNEESEARIFNKP